MHTAYADTISTSIVAVLNNIEAICYELGTQGGRDHDKNVSFGKQVLEIFLAIHGLIGINFRPLHDNPLIVQVDAASPHVRVGEEFKLAEEFKSFQILQLGQLVANDGTKHIYAHSSKQQVILLPKPHPDIGREAFELASIIKT